MSKKIFDILIIGDLAGNDIILAEQFSSKGLKCCVLRRGDKKNSLNKITPLPNYHKYFHPEEIIYYNSKFEFKKYLKQSCLIISFTGSVISGLGPFLWLLRKILFLPPIINITTGSDITELAVEKSINGFFYRQYLKSSSLNCCVSYPHALKNIVRLKVENVIFLPWPFNLIPQDKSSIKLPNPVIDNHPISFFHPSNLDWKFNDSGEFRNSSKGNDRFIKAFARAIHNGLNAQCVILDRGPDKDIAKTLISELNVEDKFIWKTHLSREELFKEYQNCDVVVDQFDVGGFGGMAIEAMSLGKPLLMYCNENCMKLVYNEFPPVLNCYTDDEIFQKIMSCEDRNYLFKIGVDTLKWVNKYHNWDSYLNILLFHYTRLTGNFFTDYGWNNNLTKKSR